MKEQLDMCCRSRIGYLTVTEEKDTYPIKQNKRRNKNVLFEGRNVDHLTSNLDFRIM